MPAIRRTLKNVVKNYSDAQVKVREATSNDPWGPSSTLMSEIADLTYNVVAFTEIMQMVWKRLNDDGKNWRHVYKSLVVLDYIIKTGSEKVAQQCKENFHVIKTLTSFQHTDADNKDQGMNVREKAKQLVTILSDDEKLKAERAKALKAKERFAQNAMGVGNEQTSSKSRMRLGGSPTSLEGHQDSPGYADSSPGSGSAGSPSEIECVRPSSAGEEELQLQLALAMSKEEHEEAVRKQKSDDIKLQMAIEQSKEQAKNQGSQPSTLLDLAGSSVLGSQAAASDPWGFPVPSSQPTDPWGSSLPGPDQVTADPWAPQDSAPGVNTQASGSSDPWGLPVSSPSPPLNRGAWASSSPSSRGSPWGGSSSAGQQHSIVSAGFDAFGVPRGPVANGSSANSIDSEFDLLSARSTDASPVKSSSHGLEEFDLLSGVSQTHGSDIDAFNMDGLSQNLPQGQGKKKSAEMFLGGHANLVNLDELVSSAPTKGNNPFAVTPGYSNPFQDPGSAAPRMPMAQMPATCSPGFTPPLTTRVLPAPLLPLGSTPPPMQQQPRTQQQSYNPFL
ncbi:hypothetical protein BsWGS_20663 [Bradybaena similaris]